MTIREIITLPDPLLKSVSKPVEKVDEEVLTLLDDMLETMYEAPGIGLAAVQVAVPRRLLVVDPARDDEPKNPHFLINPEILERSDDLRVYEEGCLSIPDVYAEVERPDKVRVRYVGRDGKIHELDADGLLATVIQHEVDHLNGILFIDHLSRLKRNMVVKRFLKARKDDVPV